MTKKIKTILVNTCLLTILGFLILSIAPIYAAEGTFEQVINGTASTGKAAGFQADTSGKPNREFAEAFARYANGLIILMGALFAILVIYAGFLWMTASGKEEQVNKAKQYLLGATIGITVVIGARLFVEFILSII
jgi:hypothetical protein